MALWSIFMQLELWEKNQEKVCWTLLETVDITSLFQIWLHKCLWQYIPKRLTPRVDSTFCMCINIYIWYVYIYVYHRSVWKIDLKKPAWVFQVDQHKRKWSVVIFSFMDKLVRTARRRLGQVGYGELLFFLKEAPHFPWKQTTSKQNIILMITLQLCEANTGKII